MRGRRVWIRSADGHRVYETKKLSVDGDKCHAAYDTITGDIEVQVADPEVMRKAMFHEHCHKALAPLSGDERSAIFENEDLEDAEEKLCLFLEKGLYELLTRNGWLKYPSPPSAPRKERSKK